MPRESNASKSARAIEAVKRIDQLYPDLPCHLHHRDPFTLTIAVLLSAQTTDAQVNKVTPQLFDRFGDPASMAAAPLKDVEACISSLGFYRNKAKNCIAAAQVLLREFGGEVPQSAEELMMLPGVGRKTANVVLNVAFGIVSGIAVDTHVFRIAQKLKLSSKQDPLDLEQDLLKLLPKEYWKDVNHQWVQFGRDVCIARRPQCALCVLNDICPSAFAEEKSKKKAKKVRRSAKEQ